MIPHTLRRCAVLFAVAASALWPSPVDAAPEIAIEDIARGTNLLTNRVIAFGSNSNGQTSVPATLTGVIAIAAEENNSLALQTDGTVVAWGANGSGQSTVPAGLNDVVAIAAGGIHHAARKADGSVVGWGFITPIPAGLPNLIVDAGSAWSIALRTDGTAVVWGQSAPPVPAGLGPLFSVAAGDYHALAIKADRTVVAWGNNSNGQSTVPADLTCVDRIAAGKRFSLALRCAGIMVGWGFVDNGGGLPVTLPASLVGVQAIAAGGHALALKLDGTLVGWGRNAEGQLTAPPGSAPMRAIAAGGYHSLALAGSIVNFGSQLVGATNGAVRHFRIRNSGADPLVVSGMDIFGSFADEWTIVSTALPGTIPAGGQADFSVSFRPRDDKSRTVAVRVFSNDSDEARFEILVDGVGYRRPEIDVSGNGQPIAAGDQTPSLADHTDFGDVVIGKTLVRNYLVSNTGSAPLNITDVFMGDEHYTDFTITAAPSVIAAGASANLQVAFVPGGPGRRTGVLRIISDDFDETRYDFRMQGFGTSPEIALASNGQDIADGAATPVDFGDADTHGAPVVRTFTISNSGDGALDVGTVAITGAGAQDYSVATPPPASIAPGASANFAIRFMPGATGVRAAGVSIGNSDNDENPYDFSMVGVGYSVEIAVAGNGADIADGDTSPSAADHTDYGAANLVSGDVVRSFVIRNTGTGPRDLTLGTLAIGGAHAADFALRTPPPARLAPGESATVRIAFAPSAIGVRNATVTLPNNDADENPFEFAIRGDGRAPEIAIEQPAGSALVSGGVRAWGANDAGQTNVPANLVGVVELDAGFGNTVARKRDGTVVAWGNNDFGQNNVPAGLRGVVAISASRWHTLALKNDGTVVAWGRNDSGQCNVAGLSGIVAIAAGDEHSVVVRSDGTVHAWGANYFGQTDVPNGLTGVVGISAGYGHVLALRGDGTVVAWGNNQHGQANVPAGLSDIVAISAGFHHSLALRSDGTAVGWGEDEHGDAGGAFHLADIAALNAGVHHGVARGRDGRLHAWGWNEDSQLAIPAPIAPSGDAPVVAMAAGERHTAVSADAVVAFAPHQTGSANAKTFTIRNSGTTALTIASVTLLGADATDFTVDTAGLVTTLPAGNGQTSFKIAFHANGGHERQARVRVVSDDADEGVFDIALVGQTTVAMSVSGNGVDIANGDSSPDRADGTDFGVVINPAQATRTYTIRNAGPGELALGDILVTGDSAVFALDTRPPRTIAANGSATFRLRFAPGSIGEYRATLTFASNDTDDNPFRLNVAARSRGFDESDTDAFDAAVTGGDVRAMATDGFGMVVIGGTFDSVRGVARRNIARLFSDGSLDPEFDPDVDGTVHSVSMLPNGQLLIAGEFATVGGVARRHVARLNDDGTLDATFDPNPSGVVYTALQQVDGTVLLGGAFTTLQPGGAGAAIARPYLARIRANGTVDETFHPAPDDIVRTLAVQPDGKIVAGGDFLHMATNATTPVSRLRLARVLGDGTLDAGFDPRADGTVRVVALQADDKLLVGGDFGTLRPGGGAVIAQPHLARLDANGAVDVSFDPRPDGAVLSIVPQADRQILVGGRFGQFRPGGGVAVLRQSIARLDALGVPDPRFDPNPVATTGTPHVSGLAQLPWGAVLIGGRFDGFAPYRQDAIVPRTLYARLLSGSVSQEIVMTGHDSVALRRSGALPELFDVRFELSVGSGWLPLGLAERVGDTPEWVMRDLVLPREFSLRLLGAVRAGSGNASGTLVSQFFWVGDNPAPAAAVRGNGVDIANGDETPRLADHTDFGSTPVSGGTVVRSFVVHNDGSLPLRIDAPAIDGADAGDFTIVTALPPSIEPGASAPLEIRFDPDAAGPRTARVRFGSNDFLANPFAFAIGGVGNSAPTGIALDNTTIAENNAPGVTVGQLTATDPDGGSHTFSLVSGQGDADNARFTLAGNVLRLAVSADYESQSLYQLRVQADDGRGGLFARELTVAVRNVNEPPIFVNGANVTVPVTTTPQSVPGWATAIDDGDSTVAQSLTFEVDVVSGAALFSTAPAISSTGQLSFTPSGNAGSATVAVALRDDASINGDPALTSAVQTFVIRVGTNPQTDLAITLGNGTGFVNGAAFVDYVIAVHNAGPAAVTAASVRNEIGVGTDFSAAQWTCTPSPGATCNAGGTGALDQRVTLQSGASVQILFRAMPWAGVETPVSHLVSVAPPGDIDDVDLGNNVATDGPDVRGIFRNGFERNP